MVKLIIDPILLPTKTSRYATVFYVKKNGKIVRKPAFIDVKKIKRVWRIWLERVDKNLGTRQKFVDAIMIEYDSDNDYYKDAISYGEYVYFLASAGNTMLMQVKRIWKEEVSVEEAIKKMKPQFKVVQVNKYLWKIYHPEVSEPLIRNIYDTIQVLRTNIDPYLGVLD